MNIEKINSLIGKLNDVHKYTCYNITDDEKMKEIKQHLDIIEENADMILFMLLC